MILGLNRGHSEELNYTSGICKGSDQRGWTWKHLILKLTGEGSKRSSVSSYLDYRFGFRIITLKQLFDIFEDVLSILLSCICPRLEPDLVYSVHSWLTCGRAMACLWRRSVKQEWTIIPCGTWYRMNVPGEGQIWATTVLQSGKSEIGNAVTESCFTLISNAWFESLVSVLWVWRTNNHSCQTWTIQIWTGDAPLSKWIMSSQIRLVLKYESYLTRMEEENRHDSQISI